MAKNMKVEKLNSLIFKELTFIISREYSNIPIMQNIIIHEVVTSNDLSISKVYYSVINLDILNINDVKNAIRKYCKNIRFKLSKKLTIYKTPELIFIYDKTLENANKIQEILNYVNANKHK